LKPARRPTLESRFFRCGNVALVDVDHALAQDDSGRCNIATFKDIITDRKTQENLAARQRSR
jgi:hypothetical protein